MGMNIEWGGIGVLIWEGLNELIYVKSLKKYPTHSKHSICVKKATVVIFFFIVILITVPIVYIYFMMDLDH